jgi:hypothetical protein
LENFVEVESGRIERLTHLVNLLWSPSLSKPSCIKLKKSENMVKWQQSGEGVGGNSIFEDDYYYYYHILRCP